MTNATPNNENNNTAMHACAMVVFALSFLACGPPLVVLVDCDDHETGAASEDTASEDTGVTGDTDEMPLDLLDGDGEGDGDTGGDGDEAPLDLPQGDGDGDGDAGECACVDPSPGDGDGDPAGDGDGEGWGCGCAVGVADSLCYLDGVCAYFIDGCPPGGWQPVCAA